MRDRLNSTGDEGDVLVAARLFYINASLVVLWGGFGSCAVAFSLSPAELHLDKSKIFKAAVAVFKMDLAFIFVGVSSVQYFIPLFFQDSTSDLTRFLIRGVLQSLLLSLIIEVGSR